MNDFSDTKQPIHPKTPTAGLGYWGLIGYLAFGLAAPYYLVRILTRKKYRAGLRQRLTWFTAEEKQRLQEGPFIWIHAVSVGELLAARPLLKRIKQEFPSYKILVTTVTETGQNLARQSEEIDVAIYLPLDLYPLCRKVMAWARPACLLIMETELWPNFIRSATDLQIPFFLLNARLSDKSFSNYCRFKGLFQPLLHRFTRILTQSEEDKRRFLQIGAPESTVLALGNLKFEAAARSEDGDSRQRWRELFHIQDNEILLLGGSTFPGEESGLVRIIKTLQKDNIPVRLILAPRHIERTESILEELQSFGIPIVRRSTLNETSIIDPSAIILLDTIGELRTVYATADIVFIGKSLCGQGGQNPIEAAAWGRPILFGKNMQNFRDIAALFIRAEAAISVESETELLEACRSLCHSPSQRKEMGQKALAVIAENQGALDRIIQTVQPYLEDKIQSQ